MKGVYKIACTINDKFYIGSSVDVNRRFYCHRHLLKSNKHWNVALQKDWNQYGSQTFVFKLLESVEKELVECEQKWLDTTKCYKRNIGYNISFIAGRQHSGFHLSKEWIITDPLGNEFIIDNLNEFCKQNSLSSSAMYNIAAGYKNHCKQWHCRATGTSMKEWVAKRNTQRKKGCRFCVVTDPENNNFLVCNLKQFCKNKDLDNSALGKITKGKMKTHKNWTCKYV